MTDPLTVLQTTEAIGGLINILNNVKNYCLKLKNARKDAFNLLERLDDGFDKTLMAIKRILRERRQQATQDESQSDMLGGVAQAAEKCKEALSAIYRLLRRFMDENDRIVMTGILESSKFVQMKPRIEKQMTTLAEYKSTLTIALLVLSCHDQQRQHGQPVSDASEQLRRDSGMPPLSDTHAEPPIDGLGVATSNLPEEQEQEQEREAPEQQTEITNEISPGLLKAVKESDQRLVQELLNSGTNIDGAGKRGTALHYAVEKGNLSMIDLLLRHRADVNIKDSYEETALSKAIQENHVSIVKRLLDERAQQIDLKTRHEHDGTLLHYAVMHKDTTCTNLLVECLPDLLFTKDRSGQTALHYSADKMHLAQTVLLLERGANANEFDHTGRTPLFLTLATHGSFQEDMLRRLEKSGGTIGDLSLSRMQQTRWNLYLGRDSMARDAQRKNRRTETFSGPSAQPDVEQWRSEMPEPEQNRGRKWSKSIMRRWSEG